MRIANLLGQTFGFLHVVDADRRPGRRLWLCRCRCGNTVSVTTSNLKIGGTQSCGCKRAATRETSPLRHGNNRGGQRTKEYRTWAHIRGRCNNPTDHAYKDYGGRGITLSERWETFEQFLVDMGPAPTPQHSIDRIDNNLGYQPGNCRWATQSEQARNTRRTIKVDGVCLKDICEARGLSYGAVQARIRRGAAIDHALSPLQAVPMPRSLPRD